MTKLNNWPLAGLFCTALAGCMGGGDDVSSRLSYDQQIALAARLADTLDVSELVAPSSLPTTGGPNYSGNLGISLNSGTADAIVMFGRLDMAANFEDSTVSGNASEFVDSANGEYSGQFTLENGQIDRTAAGGTADRTLTADLEGSITSSGNQVYTSDATLQGDFFGDDQNLVTGVVEGNILIGGTPAIISNGAFAAER